MKKTQIILAVITGLVVLSAFFGFLGYFGAQTMRVTRQRSEARAAFAAKDWKRAEKLLKAYVMEDLYSEEDFVRLAQIYRHFGNTEEEMRSWCRASALNPAKREYWDNYITCALNARAFPHLYTTLAYKLNLNEDLSPRERMLYFICLVVMNRDKDAEQLYEDMLDDDEAAFRHDDLGRFADFLMLYNRLAPDDRAAFLRYGVDSDDSFVRLESILYTLDALEPTEEEVAAESAGDEEEVEGRGQDGPSVFERKEAILKRVVDMNRFVGIPLLAEFYFSQLRFGSVIELAEPYLEDIDNAQLAVIYAESCVFDEQPEKLKPLIDHFRSFGRKYRPQILYFEALRDFAAGGEKFDDLVLIMRELGGTVQTDLANLINLRIALNNDNVETIGSSLAVIMKSKPFYDLQDRARAAVRRYLETKLQEDPSLEQDTRMAKLAQLVSTHDIRDEFLMHLILSDLNRRNVVTRQVIEEYMSVFPDDPYLLQIAAEFELFYGNPELSLAYTERYYAQKGVKPSRNFDLLHMLALEVMGNIDAAAKEYTELVGSSGMDRGILFRYFQFCIQHKRETELFNMAERLDALDVPELKSLAPFFRAEVLFLRDNVPGALSLLESARTDDRDFALHAADMFRDHGSLGLAATRYLELLDTYPDRQLILADIAEVYLAMQMKSKALSYAEQAWEADPDESHAQFVYAKILAACGRYQDAEKVLRIPYREVELPAELRELWTDIMIHCVREDFENRLYLRAYDRANHYLILYPGDYVFQEFKERAEEEFRQPVNWDFPEE